MLSYKYILLLAALLPTTVLGSTFISTTVKESRATGVSFSVDSKFLQDERRIDLYLPDKYEDSTRNYPIVVVLDSNYLFDLTVSILKNRWRRDLAPQSIVVGIQARDANERFGFASPVQRIHGEGVIFEQSKPDKMDDFIQKELLPYIDAEYRTQHHRTIIGMSPTATNVVYDYLKKQPYFNAHIALAADFLATPSFNGSPYSLVFDLSNSQSDKGFIFFSLASDDVLKEPDRGTPFQIMSKDTYANKGIHTFIAPKTEHYQQAGISLERAFSLLYPIDLWRPDYASLWSEDSNPLDYLKNFYSELDEQYQMQTYPLLEGYWTRNSIVGTVALMNERKNYKAALALLQWTNSLLSDNQTVLTLLTEQAIIVGDRELANQYLNALSQVVVKQGSNSSEDLKRLKTKINAFKPNEQR